MKDRIKELRKALNMTQQTFADKIGMKRNSVANYELGRNTPIDPVIHSICREFGVNEEWLREGKGDMFKPVNEAVKQSALLLGDDPDFEALVNMYSQLNEENKKLFIKLGYTLMDEDK